MPRNVNSKKLKYLGITYAGITIFVALVFGLIPPVLFARWCEGHSLRALLDPNKFESVSQLIFQIAILIGAIVFGLVIWIVSFCYLIACAILLQARIMRRFLDKEEMEALFKGHLGSRMYVSGKFIDRRLSQIINRE